MAADLHGVLQTLVDPDQRTEAAFARQEEMLLDMCRRMTLEELLVGGFEQRPGVPRPPRCCGNTRGPKAAISTSSIIPPRGTGQPCDTLKPRLADVAARDNDSLANPSPAVDFEGGETIGCGDRLATSQGQKMGTFCCSAGLNWAAIPGKDDKRPRLRVDSIVAVH